MPSRTCTEKYVNIPCRIKRFLQLRITNRQLKTKDKICSLNVQLKKSVISNVKCDNIICEEGIT